MPSTATPTGRTGRRRAWWPSHGPATTSSTAAAANSPAPRPVPGQGTVARGASAAVRAILAIARVGSAASHATQPAAVVDTTESSAVATPRTVAGATKGAASRFATTPTTDTELCSSTITGAHISWAATGTAKAGPQPRMRRGRHRPIAAPQGPANSSSPKVARVDSAKPADRDSHGSQQSRTRTATESAGMPARRLDVLRPSNPTPPIAAARTTLGSGRTSTTNPSRSTAASGGRQRRRTPRRPANPRAAARTIATLEPLTADRWVIPVTSMASSRSAGVREVSPMTSPGRRPRASVGSPSVAAANRVRTTSAVRATRPGSSRTVGEPRGVSTATTSSARSSAGASCPTACTRDCQGRPSQVRSANTRTGDATAVSTPRPSMWSTSSRRTTPAAFDGRPGGASTALGSVDTRPRTSTVARCWARSRTGPASRTLCAAASAVRAKRGGEGGQGHDAPAARPAP